MINIENPEDCCGCEACRQSCPKQCIFFKEDKQGFLYPKVDKSICIDCGLCERVCPVINQGHERKPIQCYAGWTADNELRVKSSSGGVFTVVAERIISDGGVVFGVRFDDEFRVIHDYTETVEGLSAFRGSKYVQSRIGDSFRKAEQFLKAGRKVLFTGTACQISGLHNYLRKDYPHLFTIDVICHGVPSPLVWKEYLKGVGKNADLLSLKEMASKVAISFRDKRMGWKKCGFAVSPSSAEADDKNSDLPSIPPFYETINENAFLQVFLRNLCLRPSCYTCPSKGGKSSSDITIGDFWGVDDTYPQYDDDLGCSAIMINTTKGQQIFDKLPLIKHLVYYQDILSKNPSLENSVTIPELYSEFWRKFCNSNNRFRVINQLTKPIKPSLKSRIVWNIKRFIKL